MTLTKAEQLELGRRIKSGDKAARERMITANLPLVKWTMRRWYKWHSDEMFDEMHSAGCVGLCIAADKYDSDFGCTFSGYAVLHIKNEITDYIHRWDGTDLRGRDVPILRMRDAIEQRLSSGESPADVAASIPVKVGKKPFTGEHMLTVLRATAPKASLSKVNNELLTGTVESHERAVITNTTAMQIREQISKLHPRIRTIFEMTEQGYTKKQIGKKLGITFQGVSIAEWRAVNLLRKRLKIEVGKAA